MNGLFRSTETGCEVKIRKVFTKVIIKRNSTFTWSQSLDLKFGCHTLFPGH